MFYDVQKKGIRKKMTKNGESYPFFVIKSESVPKHKI